MKLLDYLRKNNLTHEEFSKKVGVSRVQITRLVNLIQDPSVRLIERIKIATNNKVTYEDLIKKEDPSVLRRIKHRNKNELLKK